MKKIIRKSNRLHSNLYHGGYWYFVTICTHKRSEILSEIISENVAEASSLPYHVSSSVKLKEVGSIVESILIDIPQYYSDVRIIDYVIMPNHIHAIIGIESGSKQSLPQVVGAIKSLTTRRYKKHGSEDASATPRNVKTYLWQKSFHDRIIRNQKEYDILTQYIHNNPILWDQDSLNPLNGVIEDTKTE